MSQFLDYLSTLLHIVGIVLLAGGHIWFGLLSALAERRRDREGVRFLATTLPLMANVFGVGVLLLFGSGALKLLLWGEPGLIFLPDPYGWLLLSKLLLYMLIVGNGLLIERRYLPHVWQQNPAEMSRASPPTAAWHQVKMRARLNLLLILVVVALGEALRYAKL
ncbi:hypothetical protein NKDENANG_03803 [Candidatus Entotheonellaceae bacterium PAL068K]